jgi:hypothetical protein
MGPRIGSGRWGDEKKFPALNKQDYMKHFLFNFCIVWAVISRCDLRFRAWRVNFFCHIYAPTQYIPVTPEGQRMQYSRDRNIGLLGYSSV